jgi:hypothetical protein
VGSPAGTGPGGVAGPGDRPGRDGLGLPPVPSEDDLDVDGLSPAELAVVIERFEEHQRDLEERVADIADLVRALKARNDQSDRKGSEGQES